MSIYDKHKSAHLSENLVVNNNKVVPDDEMTVIIMMIMLTKCFFAIVNQGKCVEPYFQTRSWPPFSSHQTLPSN